MRTHEEALIRSHEETLTDICKQLKDYNKGLDDTNKQVHYLTMALGIKDRSNGERDKEIESLQKRYETIGEKAETEDKTLLQHIIDIKLAMKDKADKDELPAKWLLAINTIFFSAFVVALLYIIFLKQISGLLGI
jgi:hypothetical protein